MSIFSKLFGGGAKPPAAPQVVAEEAYEGFSIEAKPQPEGGQYRLAASITKVVDGETRVHHLLRADLFPNADDAARFAILKAKRLIDEQGEGMFGG